MYLLGGVFRGAVLWCEASMQYSQQLHNLSEAGYCRAV